MLSNTLKNSGLSFEEIQSIKQGRKDISEGNVYSHNEVMLYAREALLTHAKTHV